jgi:hypothetical protein
VRRALIGLGAFAVALIFISRAAGGVAPVAQRPDAQRGVHPGRQAPQVAAPVGDPYAAARKAAEPAEQQKAAMNPQDQERFDLAVAAVSKFAPQYATYSADDTPETYAARLPQVSDALRAAVVKDAAGRWPEYSQKKVVAVGRLSGEPAQVVSWNPSHAQVLVHVIQDTVRTDGQRSNAFTYRIDLEWSTASASPAPPAKTPGDPSASPGASASTERPNPWTIVAVRTEQ